VEDAMTGKTIVAASFLLLIASGAKAQVTEQVKPVRAFVGGGLVLAQAVGEFHDFIDGGVGGAGHFVLKLDSRGVLGVRADAGFVVYGHETQEVCLSTTVGCRIRVDLTTTNNIAFFNIGPQLMLPAGPVQPYINGSIGVSYFSTTSSISDVDDGDGGHFDTTNFDDATFAWQAGTGLRIPVRSAGTPIFIDLGARYNTNGEVEYLREGDIIDHPDGSITLNPRLSDANLVTYVIGVSVGVRW
jgi:hypothetical protein